MKHETLVQFFRDRETFQNLTLTLFGHGAETKVTFNDADGYHACLQMVVTDDNPDGSKDAKWVYMEPCLARDIGTVLLAYAEAQEGKGFYEQSGPDIRDQAGKPVRFDEPSGDGPEVVRGKSDD